ncbi:hypothetical protein Tco_0666152 [Tanacetum coccineum]
MKAQEQSSRTGNDACPDDANIKPRIMTKSKAKTYKDLYDSIKKTRVQMKDHNDSLIAQVNKKSTENADLKAQLQEKFSSQVDVKSDLSKPVTQDYFPKGRKSAFAKPHHVIASSASRNSSKNMPIFSSNDMTSAVYEKTSPSSCLRWIPTGKLFDSCMSKVDTELPHGANVDIFKIRECKQTLDLSAGTSINVQKKQRIDLSAGTSYNVKKENLKVWLLKKMISHKPVYDSHDVNDSHDFNEENQVVSKSSAVTTVDASDKRQQQPDTTSSTSTLATTVTADGNFD